MSREERKKRRPEFRAKPLPKHLKRLRYGLPHPEYARFYCLYKTTTGKTKRASFQVRVSPKLNNKRVGEHMRTVCTNMVHRRIPEHRQGDVFNSFKEVLKETPWFRVRKIMWYRAGAVYEK